MAAQMQELIVDIVHAFEVPSSRIIEIGLNKECEEVKLNLPSLQRYKNSVPDTYPAILIQERGKPYSCIIFYLDENGLLRADDHIDYFCRGVGLNVTRRTMERS